MLDANFKLNHFAIIDLVCDEFLNIEQAVLDDHDDKIADLVLRIQQLSPDSAPPSPSTTLLWTPVYA